ncbi:hypothetical protein [Haloarcula nitratireducens]|uniref:Uncharacterized protein n=1 Tax=Haloarcula nitratireducens TaxID=2487749 RepID=A0AAW4PGA1_9EURY|nr:hypothetical protein [Halomicroarcula nitratireducens]MBX0297456.1 hypothetical protein [Halomicroarcula nitratireducens]
MTPDTDDTEVEYATEPTLARTLIEDRGGYPGHPPESEGEGDRGLLRIGFRDQDEDLKEISWEQFREEFEEKELAVAYRPDEEPVENDQPVALLEREELEGQS